MENLKNLIESYLNKELEIEIDGVAESCSMIDWNQILVDHDTWAKGMDGMSEEEKNNYCNHSVSDLVNIYEYFLNEEEFEQKVDNKEWVPFAVLGMYKPHIHGYAEMNNQGMLLFNLKEDKSNPSIMHIMDGEEQMIAENFSDLEVNEIIDND